MLDEKFVRAVLPVQRGILLTGRITSTSSIRKSISYECGTISFPETIIYGFDREATEFLAVLQKAGKVAVASDVPKLTFDFEVTPVEPGAPLPASTVVNEALSGAFSRVWAGIQEPTGKNTMWIFKRIAEITKTETDNPAYAAWKTRADELKELAKKQTDKAAEL